MEDNTPIFILIVLFVILGLAYTPLQNAGERGATRNSATNSPAIQNIGGDSSYSSNQDIAKTIKEAEREVERLEENIEESIEESKRSAYFGKIRMSSLSGRTSVDPSIQYFYLYTNLNKGETINITGWYFQSEVTGYFAVIGQAALLPFPFSRIENDVVLQSGDRAVITKGFSPIGISFRTNICTGYFEENRTFYPSLQKQCPRAEDENLPRFSPIHDRNDECLDLIEQIPRCTTRTSGYFRDLPDTIPQSCKDYVTTQINYNTCVVKHFDDTNFPGNEYRLFLNKFGPLWRTQREKINLHDQNGLIVDTIEY